ncbi:MAG: TolC family protein [Lentisphaerae bacterium]|nr:TolC family protein [Lentisphaerota bacterium]
MIRLGHRVALGWVLAGLAAGAIAQTSGPSATASALTMRRLTLADAYALAAERSETLGIAVADWRAAEARYRQETAAQWPELSAAGSGLWREAGEDGGRASTYRAGVSAAYPIFNGFRTARLAAARDAEGEALSYDLARQRQLLYQDVADAFYQSLASMRELMALDEQAVALAQRVDELKRRIQLGRSRTAELLAAQTQSADVRIFQAQAAGVRDAALELVSFLTGLPAEELQLEDETALPELAQIGRYLSQTNARPDVLAEEARVREAAAETRAEEARRNVQVDVGGNLYAWSDPGDPGDWDVTLRASVPIFDHGRRRAGTAEKRQELRAAELQLSAAQRSADRDVRLAFREVRSALEQWAAVAEALRVATENVDTQTRDYAMGRANNLDVLAAVFQLHTLRRRAAALEMQAKAAAVHLLVAAGEPPA